jgi:hypothetical protein
MFFNSSKIYLAKVVLYLILFKVHVYLFNTFHNIGCVMVLVCSREVDRGFEPRWGQTKDYKIGICCLSGR